MRQKTKFFIDQLVEEYQLNNFIDEVYNVINKVSQFKSYNKILICGNGGSSSDSLHIVGELMKSFSIKRKIHSQFLDKYEQLFGKDQLLQKLEGTIRAISLSSETALMTAISNDIGYDYVFSQQVYGYADEGDLLFVFTTSGNSVSVINACKVAKTKGVTVVGFTGKTGGEVKKYIDLLFNVDETETFRV